MNLSIQSKIHQRPLFIYDGLSPFCLFCLKLVKWFTYDKIHFVPYQQLKEIIDTNDSLEYSGNIFFISNKNIIYKNFEALLHILSSVNILFKFSLVCYQRFFFFRLFTQFLFNSVRKLYYFILNRKSKNSYIYTCDLFIRLIGLIYFFAFLALFLQIEGLYGENGILPFSLIFKWFSYVYGFNQFLKIPSLFWIDQSNLFIVSIMYLGLFFSVLLIIGIIPMIALTFLWFLYLSVVSAGLIFMQYQWDILLLEIGFLSIFMSPWSLTLYSKSRYKVSGIIIFLFRLILFKLFFSSGLVKVLSPNSSWISLEALTYHFQTQPLPQISAWFIHKMPVLFLKLACLVVLIIELLVPFLFFASRKIRRYAFYIVNTFMLSIIATGNYGFFNILVMVLSLTLLDDLYVKKISTFYRSRSYTIKKSWRYPFFCSSIALIIGMYSVTQEYYRFLATKSVFFETISTYIKPFYISNSYGLFAHITKDRYELEIQTSQDALNWQTYNFKYKIDGIGDFPLFNVPLHPRLDWQMWFASLRPYSDKSWINHLILSLFKQKDDVLNLFIKDKNTEIKPKFIQIIRFKYHYSNLKNLKDKKFWEKVYFDTYLHPIKNPY